MFDLCLASIKAKKCDQLAARTAEESHISTLTIQSCFQLHLPLALARIGCLELLNITAQKSSRELNERNKICSIKINQTVKKNKFKNFSPRAYHELRIDKSLRGRCPPL